MSQDSFEKVLECLAAAYRQPGTIFLSKSLLPLGWGEAGDSQRLPLVVSTLYLDSLLEIL
jgi:hypothetical protein